MEVLGIYDRYIEGGVWSVCLGGLRPGLDFLGQLGIRIYPRRGSPQAYH